MNRFKSKSKIIVKSGKGIGIQTLKRIKGRRKKEERKKKGVRQEEDLSEKSRRVSREMKKVVKE